MEDENPEAGRAEKLHPRETEVRPTAPTSNRKRVASRKDGNDKAG